MKQLEIIEITGENVEKEGLFCLKNIKNPGFAKKREWLEKQWLVGLKMKMLKVNGETAGFIEYIPGEFAWRPVNALDYLFIHCMWVYPKKFYKQGLASMLIDHVAEDAKVSGYGGVVVQSSKGSWMTGPAVFEKNGFRTVEKKDRYELLVLKHRAVEDPSFISWENNLAKYNGLNLIIAYQCPLFAKSLEELSKTASSLGHELKVHILQSPNEAQQAPSGYGVYSLVYNGKLLVDHYISNTRFKNILTKEI